VTEITLTATQAEHLVQRLAEVEGAAAAAVPEGWTLPPALEIDLAHVVLDLLGAPVHTWNWPVSEDGYSRDWLTDLWLNCTKGGMTAAEFIAEVEAERREFGREAA
jgi:hypothetical protein